MVNRFYAQRLGPRWNSFGVKNAGVMFVLPLSPRFAIFSYDGGVYTCPDKIGNVIEVNQEVDIDAINDLQFLKAANNIYFANWIDGDAIRTKLDMVVQSRPKSWHEIHFAVKDEVQEGGTHQRFRVVHTQEERLAAEKAFIHLQGRMLNPKVWCSKIRFRAKPIFVDTHSGAGFLRRNQK
jgi:hypothetical protein